MKKFFLVGLLVFPALRNFDPGKTIIWHLNNTAHIAAFSTTILGNPVVKVEGTDSSIYFNGINDGLVIPAIPIEGWQDFTIEVLFKPSSDGPSAPRFIHMEDSASNRVTLELRLTKNGQWYLDGFLKNGRTKKGLTLIDSTKLHPANKWYWAALVYSNNTMATYINGKKELEGGEIGFPAMTKGNMSIGVRLNKVDWFKGQVQEIRFHPAVIEEKDLQH